jgi:hypothetical protein
MDTTNLTLAEKVTLAITTDNTLAIEIAEGFVEELELIENERDIFQTKLDSMIGKQHKKMRGVE